MKMRGVALLVVAVMGLVSCSSDPSSSENVATTTTQSSDGVSSPVSTVDNFVASTVSGEKFVLSSALALKPVVLWFWAPG